MTNVLKHAEAASVEVRLEYRDNAPDKGVVLTIADHPGTASSGTSPPAFGSHLSPEPTPAPAGRGQGLTNLHQRLAVVGGSLKTGPGPDGGFIVYARIPTKSSQPTPVNPEVS